MIMLHHLDPAKVLGVPQSSSTRVAAESESCAVVEYPDDKAPLQQANATSKPRAEIVRDCATDDLAKTGAGAICTGFSNHEFPRDEEEYETFMAELAAMEARWM